jgi:chaperonin GroEL
MPYKQVLFESAAREKLLRGVTALSDAVRITLGPKSKRVLIEKKWGAPLVCDDGVTIAKEFDLKDPVENLGVRALRQAAERTGDAVGDGTTTATILAHAIFSEGLRNVAAGASAVGLKRGLDRALQVAVDAVRGLSRPVARRIERAHVATVAAHNDPAIGEIVADALEKVGGDGIVTVEEAKGTETSLEVVEGMQLDHGYLSPYFVTDAERMECVLENAVLLLYEGKITMMKDLLPLLEQVVRAGTPLLIIAEDIEGDALATLVVNKLRGALPCAAAKAPGYGERRKALLEDIAIVTGGQVLATELGTKLEHVSLQDLGRARRVVLDRDTTTIVGGAGDRKLIDGRIEQLRRQIEDTTSDYDREKLEERVAKLTGGVAVLRVGAASEAELKSRKEAFDDAIHATKAALQEGVVPGGGLAFLRVIEPLEHLAEDLDGDERTGVKILARALEAPARQIAENSGVDDGVVVDRLRAGRGALGFDAARGVYVDLLEAGIIDPTKVVRTALENAVSVASLLLLTEATLTEIPEPTTEAAAPVA